MRLEIKLGCYVSTGPNFPDLVGNGLTIRLAHQVVSVDRPVTLSGQGSSPLLQRIV